MSEDIILRYAHKVGYSEEEVEAFREKGHRVRHVKKLAEMSLTKAIEVEIISSKNCNSNHTVGQKLLLDADGNFITKSCPKRICIYLAAQLPIPIALINERLSEGLDPNNFHFNRIVRCADVGVNCLGYGEVMAKVEVISR
jgi:hypothetical protein